MSNKPRILFYVVHLLGIGHLQRVLAIGRSLSERGAKVGILTTGHVVPENAIPGITVFPLSTVAIRAHDFRVLYNDRGRPMQEADWRLRSRQIKSCLESFNPGVLVTEMYPFGRRKFRKEIQQLFESAGRQAKAPVIVSSVRDVIQGNRKSAHYEEMARIVEASYDGVMVHGDPAFLPLDDSFPLARRIADRIHYTGYIEMPAAPGSTGSESVDILVSAGGSDAGESLIRHCLEASRRRSLSQYHWCIRSRDWQRIGAAVEVPRHVRIENLAEDFRELLAAARLSVSQAGYNTMVDLWQTDTPAVIVPFAGGGETEQTLRASRLAETGRVVALAEDDLDADSLSESIHLALQRGRRRWQPACNGAEESAELLLQWSRNR